MKRHDIPQDVLDSLQCETVIPYGGGDDLLVVHRYSQDDYSVWFTDSTHLTDDTFGCSVRGTMLDIVNEIKEVI